MRLAAKWQGSWRWMGGFDHGRMEPCRRPGGWVDVIRIGRGEPLVSCRAWRVAGNWSGRWRESSPGISRSSCLALQWRSMGLVEYWAKRLVQIGDIGESAEDLAVLDRSAGAGASDGLRDLVWRCDCAGTGRQHPESLGGLIVYGAEARFHRTLGSSIARRVLERFPLPSDNRFVNQFFHLLYGDEAGAWPAGGLCRRTHLGDRPERHCRATGPVGVVRRHRSPLADRDADAWSSAAAVMSSSPRRAQRTSRSPFRELDSRSSKTRATSVS